MGMERQQTLKGQLQDLGRLPYVKGDYMEAVDVGNVRKTDKPFFFLEFTRFKLYSSSFPRKTIHPCPKAMPSRSESSTFPK